MVADAATFFNCYLQKKTGWQSHPNIFSISQLSSGGQVEFVHIHQVLRFIQKDSCYFVQHPILRFREYVILYSYKEVIPMI